MPDILSFGVARHDTVVTFNIELLLVNFASRPADGRVLKFGHQYSDDEVRRW
jgi:hypothetical protein